MKRRAMLGILGVVATTLPSAVRAQPSGPRVGFLANTVPLADLVNRTGGHPAPRLFEEGLRERGWVDGKNVRIVWKSAEGSLERLPALAADLVEQRVDLIVAYGPGVLAAAAKTRSIPIVMGAMGSYDGPAGLGSLARPAANVTGMTLEAGGALDGKRLSLLKQMSPNVTRVALLDGDAKAVIGQAARDAARGLDITLISTKIDSIANLASAFDNAVRAGANAILVADWPQMHWPELQRAIHALAIRHRLPAIHSVLSAADTGALLVYASDILDNYRRAPHFVDRILRGAKPSDLPVEQPTRFHLVVNRKAADAIGLSIPASILAEAERVIQ